MSCILQKIRKLNRVISFMLMLAMVVTMLPLFSVPKVYAAEPVKQVTLLSTGITSSDSSDTSICQITAKSNVTWNYEENCAVFSGNKSYLTLSNPFRSVTKNTGISIKMEAYIFSDTTGYSRLFEIGDGTVKNNMEINAGSSAHINYYTHIGGTQKRISQSQSYFNGWHTYELIFYPGGTSKMFIDEKYVSGYSASPVDSVYTSMLDNITKWTNCYVGTSIWQLSGATTTDGYLHGKIRNLTITSGAVYHADFNNNGRGSSTYDRQYVPLGGTASKPGVNPVADGNVFVDWVDSATSKNAYDFSKVITADTSIYARWHQYSVEANENKLIATCTGDSASGCTHNTTPIEMSINVDDVLYSPDKSGVSPSINGKDQFTDITKISVSDLEYYVDSELTTKTTTENSGATSIGGIPLKLGKYYAVISAAGKKAVAAFSIGDGNTNSNFSTEPLNNIITNKSSDGIAQKVFGANPTTTLKVILLNETDSVNLYKLADISWDSTHLSYGNVTWCDTVKEWFTGSEKYSDSNIATNPLLISDMTANLQSEFFDSLFSDTDGVLKNMADPTFADSTSVKGVIAEDESYYKSFENIPVGMYAVISEESYAPVVISIFPYQNGPSESWYLDSEYIARLKHSDVYVNKWINKNDISDTVAYNDTVAFDIDFKFPSFKTDYADRVTIRDGETDADLDYKLYAVDTMSPAFSLINSAGNKPYVTYSINGSAAEEFPDSVSYDELADDDTTVSKSAPVYRIAKPDVSENGVTTLTVEFNVHALKAFTKSINMNEFVITLHYQAIVTDKLEIGSDNNTNKIVLNYETSPSKTSEIVDEVYGDTYGLQVIKIDGTKSTEEVKKYLSGAEFKLYKEVKAPPENMTDVYTYDDNGKTRYFLQVKNIFTDASSNLDENGVFTSVDDENGIILKGLKEGCYILAEAHAPLGYNSLAEDIYFEINKLEEEEADNHYGGRYKVFKEMDKPDQEPTYNENGMVSLSVVNYRGLTLPSTGGAGILLFTIIGVLMMMSVIIILIIKKPKTSAIF